MPGEETEAERAARKAAKHEGETEEERAARKAAKKERKRAREAARLAAEASGAAPPPLSEEESQDEDAGGRQALLSALAAAKQEAQDAQQQAAAAQQQAAAAQAELEAARAEAAPSDSADKLRAAEEAAEGALTRVQAAEAETKAAREEAAAQAEAVQAERAVVGALQAQLEKAQAAVAAGEAAAREKDAAAAAAAGSAAEKDAALQAQAAAEAAATTARAAADDLQRRVAELEAEVTLRTGEVKELQEAREADAKAAELQTQLDARAEEIRSRDQRIAELQKQLQEAEDSLDANVAARELKDLRVEVLNQSHRLVDEGEKNLKLADRVQDFKRQLSEAQRDMAGAKDLLLGKLLEGETYDAAHYGRVSLVLLVRQFEQKVTAAAEEIVGTGRRPRLGASLLSAASGSASTPVAAAASPAREQLDDDSFEADSPAPSPAARTPAQARTVGADPLADVTGAEREIKTLRAHNLKLSNKVQALQARCDEMGQMETMMNNLKVRANTACLRQRSEKEAKERADATAREQATKVAALSEHIEKLMVHLKHEAASKARSQDVQRRLEKEVELLRGRNTILAKKNAGRERVIAELREGSKILEDQLRLMDEKYIDLRTKLDWTRINFKKKVGEADQWKAKYQDLMESRELDDFKAKQAERHREWKLRKSGGGRSSLNSSSVSLQGSQSAGDILASGPVLPRFNNNNNSSSNNNEDEDEASAPWSDSMTSQLAAERRQQQQSMLSASQDLHST